MGMVMMQQRSKSDVWDADCSGRGTELALSQEEMVICQKEMTTQLQIQHEESLAHHQM
jgi:hypothetical protein